MGHNFSILTDRRTKNAPATQKFNLYFSLIWQNICDVKTWNNSWILSLSPPAEYKHFIHDCFNCFSLHPCMV